MQTFCHMASVNADDRSQKMEWRLAGAPGQRGPDLETHTHF